MKGCPYGTGDAVVVDRRGAGPTRKDPSKAKCNGVHQDPRSKVAGPTGRVSQHHRYTRPQASGLMHALLVILTGIGNMLPLNHPLADNGWYRMQPEVSDEPTRLNGAAAYSSRTHGTPVYRYPGVDSPGYSDSQPWLDEPAYGRRSNGDFSPFPAGNFRAFQQPSDPGSQIGLYRFRQDNPNGSAFEHRNRIEPWQDDRMAIGNYRFRDSDPAHATQDPHGERYGRYRFRPLTKHEGAGQGEAVDRWSPAFTPYSPARSHPDSTSSPIRAPRAPIYGDTPFQGWSER